MSKIISFLILYFNLFIIETACSFLIVLISNSFETFDLKGSFDVAILWNVWRILFYGLPFIILYFLLFKYVSNIKLYTPLLFSLFNMLVYICLSILSRGVWGKNIPLPPEGEMFWTTCLAIFLSPLVLGYIPYFKKLMERIIK